ncbi:MAG TPA: methyltransferase domain-containing protein [Sorangium sp.]|nr:methyltransferase domain-containing protein [Sorangium sp.]
MPTVEEISEEYDKIGDLSAMLLGGNIHLGYWDDQNDDSSIQQATDRLTDLLIEKLHVEPGQRVLDVGCGNGRPALRLANSKQVEVVGITNSHHHLNQALERSRVASDRAKFQLADAMDLPFAPASFDAVLALESVSLMPEPLGAFRQMARVLRPGGRLVVASMVLSSPPSNHADERFLADFCALLKRPPFSTLDEYARFVAEVGLDLEELTDARDHVMERSFDALLPGSPAEAAKLWAGIGISARAADQVVAAIARFRAMPEAGYCLLAARRPADA